MAETIVLDPVAVAAGRTQLDITSWVDADPGVDWGDAAIQAYMADQQVGSSPVDYRLPNRMIKIPLNLRALGTTSYSSIRLSLQQKAAVFQAEGGQILRQVDTTPLYADVVNATLHLGGSILAAYRNIDVDAVLTLETLPDWYGTEITLDSASPTGILTGKLKLSAADAIVGGNYPGRCRIIVSDTSGNDQHGLLWAFRSRHYDSAFTAALSYEADALTAVNGAALVVLSGASGTGAIQITSLPAATWATMLTTTIYGSGPFFAPPGTAVDDASTGTITWSNPLHVVSNNTTSPASASLTAAAVSHYIKTSSHGFNVPVGATITGIQVAVNRQGNGFAKDAHVQLVKAGTIQATDKASAAIWPTIAAGFGMAYYGGSSDLWGTTWTVSDINNSGFGVALAATAASSDTAKVAYITATVYYTMPTTPSAMTHTGTYRVWARAYSPNATPSFRLLWGPGGLAVPAVNDAVQLPNSGAFYLLDLGQIRIDAPPVGSNTWQGAIQTQVANTSDIADLDMIYLQPLDETAGRLSYTSITPPSSLASTQPSGTFSSVTGVGTVAWTVDNTRPPDGNGTKQEATLNAVGVQSRYLELLALGFAVPSTATIRGVAVAVQRKNAVNNTGLLDAVISLVQGGTVSGDNKANSIIWSPTTSGTIVNYGGGTDLWSLTLAPSDINASNFGVAISAICNTASGVTAQVLRVTVTVYYVLASGFTVAQDAVIYASRTAELRTEGAFRTDPAGGPYAPVSSVIGDLPRIPPSRLENRPVELFARPSRGDLNQQPDSGLGGFTVQVKYRPSFLFVGA